MCRGADLGDCCAQGCDEKIRCQDTGGYCPEHDPYTWDDVEDVDPRPAVVDDPTKRHAYSLSRVTQGIRQAEASLRMAEANLQKLRARKRDLSRVHAR